MERWLEQETKYEGAVFSVVGGEAMLQDGRRVRRDVVRHRGSAAIVPVLDDCVLFVRQYRIAVGREMLEIPAGGIEVGEQPEFTARRELSEELGYEAGRLVRGPSFFSSVGFLDEEIHLFFAFDLKKAVAVRDADEQIEEVRVRLADVRRGLRAGEYDDAKTLIGLYALLAREEGSGDTENRTPAP